MKTFKDLIFKKHPIALSGLEMHKDAKQAEMYFDNEYGVSVIIGKHFYSNGIDTYELAILYKGKLCYNTGITDDVMGYLTESEITQVMIKVQSLK